MNAINKPKKIILSDKIKDLIDNLLLLKYCKTQHS